ncbi:MAG: S1C family serine protease [Phycisphaerae bacterium]
MLQILLTLFLAGLSQRAMSEVGKREGKREMTRTVAIVSDGDCNRQITATVEGDSPTQALVVLSGERGGDDSHNEGPTVRRVTKFIKNNAEGDQDSGWLGLAIGEVPDAVSAQLKRAERGIIVLSVVPESPADHAGLEAHDVIIAIGGEELDGTVRQGVEMIRNRKPGEVVEIKALHEGEEKTLTVTLGSRADMSGFSWTTELPPTADIEEEIRTHGCVARRGSHGKWVFEDLGDLAEIDDLPEDLLQLIPKAGTRSFRVWSDDGKKIVRCRVKQDDTEIEIEQEDDGPIVVTRTDADGNESTESYPDKQALRDGDPEAFELFDNIEHKVVVKVDIDGLSDLGDLPTLADIDIDLGDLEARLHDWGVHVSEGLKNYEQYLDEFRTFMERWRTDRDSYVLPPDIGQSSTTGKASRTFEVRPDGTIETRIRSGDSELTRIYENETDLKNRSPELYAKYQDLIAVEE